MAEAELLWWGSRDVPGVKSITDRRFALRLFNNVILVAEIGNVKARKETDSCAYVCVSVCVPMFKWINA